MNLIKNSDTDKVFSNKAVCDPVTSTVCDVIDVLTIPSTCSTVGSGSSAVTTCVLTPFQSVVADAIPVCPCPSTGDIAQTMKSVLTLGVNVIGEDTFNDFGKLILDKVEDGVCNILTNHATPNCSSFTTSFNTLFNNTRQTIPCSNMNNYLGGDTTGNDLATVLQNIGNFLIYMDHHIYDYNNSSLPPYGSSSFTITALDCTL